MSKGSRNQQATQRVEAEIAASPDEKPATVGALATKAVTSEVHASTLEADDDYGPSGPPSEEDEFFARGDYSFPPAAIDAEPEHTESELPPPPSPQVLARRARLRRVVGAVIGAATLLTGVVGAKALSERSDKVALSDRSLSVLNRVVPSIALGSPSESVPAAANAASPAGEKLAAGASEQAPSAAPPAAEPQAAAPTENDENDNDEQAANAAPAARRLPIIDVEIPTAPDPATDEQWQSAARNLSSKDFNAADRAFAELGRRADPATREAARLARAVWWTANGKQSAVRPVLADLAENATTPSVKQHARELLRTN